GLLTYVVLKAQAPNIATNVRRFLRYVLATLIPIVIAIGLSMGVVYLIGSSPPFQLRLTENTFAGMVIAGIIVFVLYQPLNTMTRRVLDRYWFGRAYETQEVVREYSQAVSKVISPEGVTAIAMGIIDKTLGIQRGTLLVIDEADDKGWRLRVLPGLGVPFGQPRLTLPDDTPLTAWLVDYRKPIHQYTLDVDPRFDAKNEKERQGWRQLNMEIFVPIHRSGALIGIMALGLRRSGRSYTSTELGLLATLADQTGVALENATLYDNVRRRAEQLTLLNEIGRAITTSLDLERTVGLIAARIQNAFRGATGFIFLWDESQGNLTLHSAFGPRKPNVGTFRVPLGQGVVGWVAQNGQPVLVPDFSIDSRYDRNIEGMLVPKAKSALCVPVMAKNNTIGVILVTDPSRINLSSAELGLLDSIGAFASIAIENARQVAARDAKLRRQVESLRIKIDELKRQKQVDEIVETEFFQDLRARAREMRRRHTRPRRRSRANPGEEKPDV
ncbi:MAG: GAF domain-containing protein, partial [Anaerolineales bacterium]